jgi:hypothetical protein
LAIAGITEQSSRVKWWDLKCAGWLNSSDRARVGIVVVLAMSC